MIKYLLVDLDDTLLRNSMENFAPPYFHALSTHLSPYIKPSTMLPKLMEGTQAMLENAYPDLTLEMVFDGVFYDGVGLEKGKLRPHIDEFYDSVFPTLNQHTGELPEARVMVMTAIKAGLKLVVATNPLFPMKAIHHRLSWANLDPEQVPFTLITSYEAFHFAKPNPAYYSEILDKLDARPDECVMVGNDIVMDIRPASSVGIQCFQISGSDSSLSANTNHPIGSHAQVLPWILRLNATI